MEEQCGVSADCDGDLIFILRMYHERPSIQRSNSDRSFTHHALPDDDTMRGYI